MMRIKNIKAVKRYLFVMNSTKLFILLCFFFILPIYSQSFYGDTNSIFISEGTIVSSNEVSNSTHIHITDGTLISGFEDINNVKIVYVKYHIKEKEQYAKNHSISRKEKREHKQKDNVSNKPKIIIRKEEHCQIISFSKNNSTTITPPTNYFLKFCVLCFKTKKISYPGYKKEKLSQHLFILNNWEYFYRSKIRPPPLKS